MKLYSHPASPFGRKCKIVAHELGLKLEIVVVAARDDEELRKINPLKKIPILVLDDGSSLFDSRVICEYLNEMGGGKFFPGMTVWRPTSGRWKALGLQALADGIMDAGVLGRGEILRPAGEKSEKFIALQKTKLNNSMDALEKEADSFGEGIDIGLIAVAAALGYMDFRYASENWRSTRPKLARWYDRFAQRPSMQTTVPKDA